MSYYVFRIDYGNCYDLIKKELIEHKTLRQGWGPDGMDVRKGVESFIRRWGDDGGKRRYSIISVMQNMEPGDVIVIPKLDKDSDYGDWNKSYKWAKTFTIVKCTEGYSFGSISTAGYSNEPRNDFGHKIGVELIASYSYDHDSLSRIISAKFRAYQKAINNVYNNDFINAVDTLIDRSSKDIDTHSEKSTLEALSDSNLIVLARESYLQKIVELINTWQPKQLEIIIEELFTKCGYQCLARNQFDGQGADVDLVFESFIKNTLMENISSISNELIPVIHIQAKNKKGFDIRDIEGALQLTKVENYRSVINILINTTKEFSAETKRYADDRGIILINGLDFASLLVRYGIDITK